MGLLYMNAIELKIVELKKKYADLKPRELVEAARPKDSPIHDYFTWDNTEAAEKYRLMEAARYLLLRIEVVRRGEKHIELVLERKRVHHSFASGGKYGRPTFFVDQANIENGIDALRKFLDRYAEFDVLVELIDKDKLDELDSLHTKNNPQLDKLLYCQNPLCEKRKTFESGTGIRYKGFNFCSPECEEVFKSKEPKEKEEDNTL